MLRLVFILITGMSLSGCYIKGSITELESELKKGTESSIVSTTTTTTLPNNSTTTTTSTTSTSTSTTTTTVPVDYSSGPNMGSAVITNHHTTISASYTPAFQISGFTANLDPISKYQLALGTSLGGTNILNWTDIGYDSILDKSGLALTENQNIYPQIRAVDSSGRPSYPVNGTVFQYKKPLPAPNGVINSLKKYNNNLYLGGSFSYVGTPTGAGKIISVDTGTGNISFANTNPNIAVNGKIYSMITAGTGFIIGGSFTKIAGLTGFSNLAFIRGDGSIANWKPQINGTVKSLFYQTSNGRLHVGGNFTNADGNARTNLVTYDFSVSGTPENITATVNSWAPNPNGEVRVINENVTLAFGGAFTNFNGSARSYFARVNKSTLALAASNFSPNAPVNTLERNNLTFQVGGEFTTVNGSSRGYGAKYSDSSDVLMSWDPVANGYIRKIYCYSSSCIIAGNFTTVLSTNVARPGLALVDQTTASADTNFNNFVPALPTNSKVYDVMVTNAGWLVGGDFTDYNTNRKNIASLDSVTGAYIGNAIAAADIVRVAQPTFIGGDFISAGGSVRTGFASVDLTSMSLNSFYPQLLYGSNSGSVNSVDVSTGSLSAGRIFITGNFNKINGTNRPATNSLAEIDSNGNLVSGFAPTISFGGAVLAHKIFNDTMYVYGIFQGLEGQAGGGVARYSLPAVGSPPTIDSSFLPMIDAGAMVNSVYPLTGGQVLVGGNISTMNSGGNTVGDLVRLNADGTLDLTMTGPAPISPPNNTVSNFVNTISASLNSGFVWLGGKFSYAGGNNLLEFETNNTNTLNSVDNITGTINDVLHDGNSIYLAGDMTNIGGSVLPSTAISGLAAVNLSNSTLSFTPSLAYSPTPSSLTVKKIEKNSTGQFFVGGLFDSVNSASTGCLLLLNSSGQTVTGFPW